ncbi:MAG: hypothetical protein ACYTER_06385 [Planctomycetota bacterium]
MILGNSIVRLTENEIIDALKSQMDCFEPLILGEVIKQSNNNGVDAIVVFSLQDGPSFTAAIEFLTISTPKAISQKLNVLKNSNDFQEDIVPMIVAPYISEKQAALLKDNGVSWIDLSGNMILNIPLGIYIERTGKPNKYPDTAPIKKIYQGTSSLVSRALLLNPKGFSSLNGIVDFINQRNGKITLATVSKVLKALDEDLLVSRKDSWISVKQPQLLLANLAEGYADYSKNRKDRSFIYDVDDIDVLCEILSQANLKYAFCGYYAAQKKGYGVTGQVSIFLESKRDLYKVNKMIPDIANPDEEYGQVKFVETKNPCVWFNCQEKSSGNIVDDLELYLEMMIDSPRGPKIAKQLEKQILEKFNG